jgi:hypothetical protein
MGRFLARSRVFEPHLDGADSSKEARTEVSSK